MKVIVIGAGLAGIVCSIRLQEAGHEVHLIDQRPRPGGRLQTDEVDGFRLDQGFQVGFTAYPAMKKWLNYESLQLRAFEPGALLFDGERLHEINRLKPIRTLRNPLMSLRDKVLTLKLANQSKSWALDDLFDGEDQTTLQYLSRNGFSTDYIDRFARPFFGGIFLDSSLAVSSHMFRFIWKMLSEGQTVLPNEGIQRIPEQLMSRLKSGTFTGNRTVSRVQCDTEPGVQFEDGESASADAIILATEEPAAQRLLGKSDDFGMKSSTCLYFEVEKPIVNEPILVLNSSGSGRVNEVVPVSTVAPGCAPRGRHLISATILGDTNEEEGVLACSVLNEIKSWFKGSDLTQAKHLKTYRVQYAQWPQPPGVFSQLASFNTELHGIYRCGEYCVSSSIHGAMTSGDDCADYLLRSDHR